MSEQQLTEEEKRAPEHVISKLSEEDRIQIARPELLQMSSAKI